MKGFTILAACVSLLTLSIPSHAQIAPELREDGVLYFDGNLPDKVTATVQSATTVYVHRNFETALAALYPGQKIEVIGMSPEGYLLKADVRNNSVTGWIQRDNLPPGINPALFDEAKKSQAFHDAVAVAITNKSVIQGMSTDEVKQSLGRPEQVTSHTDAQGSSTTWIYTTYRLEPQYSYAINSFGQTYLQTYYVKVPIGQRVIAFADGYVTSISERKTDPSSPGIVTN